MGHHYKPKLTKYHASDHIHIQVNNTHIREKAMKQKGPGDPMISTQSHAEKILAYTIKTAANKRSHLSMRTLGSLESKFTCKIAVYSQHLTYWLSEVAQRQHPILLETVTPLETTPIPPPENPILGEAESGCTLKQRQEITAMKFVYHQCKKAPGKSGTKHRDPRSVLTSLRWKESNPLGFMLSDAKIKEIDRDLNEDSFDSAPPSPKGPYVPGVAQAELCAWLRARMSPREAKMLITHLSTYMYPRVRKAKQIFIKGVPNAGKTTFKELLESVFYPRCFNVAAEHSSAFTACAFGQKASDAIWLLDEAHIHLISSIPPPEFNMITEGGPKNKIRVAKKLQGQTTVRYAGFTIILSNYTPLELLKGDSTRVLEFEARYVNNT